MNIENHIKEAHDRLSKYNTRFLRFVRENPGSMQADSYTLLDINDPLFVLQPWPTFIGKQTKKQMEEASVKVLDLIKALPQRLFSNDYKKISRYYGISTDLAKFFLKGVTDRHLKNLISRGDFIYTDSGLKCLEYNINTNLGGLLLPYWESLYLATPVINDFLTEHNVEIFNRNLFHFLFEHLVGQARAFYPEADEINVAFVEQAIPGVASDPSIIKFFNSIYREVMNSTFNRLQGRVFIDNSSQLTVKGDDVLYAGKKIHYLVEWNQGFVAEEVSKLFENGKLLMSNGAVSWLLSTKLNLALLSEMQDSEFFSADERETIKNHIPWTRKVTPGETTYNGRTVQLKEFILSNREKLVLKPILGSGGKDIYIGYYTSPAEWEEVVEFAMNGNDWQDIRFDDYPTESQWYQIAEKSVRVESWIVQEYIKPPTYLYQFGNNGYAEHHAVWGFFMFGGTYSGGWVRVIPVKNQNGIINCHQGARVSVAFEVDE